MLDDIQLDDDDTVDPTELVAAAGVKGRLDEDVDEVDVSQGLVGIHEAILMSIDRCGWSLFVSFHSLEFYTLFNGSFAGS